MLGFENKNLRPSIQISLILLILGFAMGLLACGGAGSSGTSSESQGQSATQIILGGAAGLGPIVNGDGGTVSSLPGGGFIPHPKQICAPDGIAKSEDKVIFLTIKAVENATYQSGQGYAQSDPRVIGTGDVHDFTTEAPNGELQTKVRFEIIANPNLLAADPQILEKVTLDSFMRLDFTFLSSLDNAQPGVPPNIITYLDSPRYLDFTNQGFSNGFYKIAEYADRSALLGGFIHGIFDFIHPQPARRWMDGGIIVGQICGYRIRIKATGEDILVNSNPIYLDFRSGFGTL